jgi:hypothetical protein
MIKTLALVALILKEAAMYENLLRTQQKAQAVARAAQRLGTGDDETREALAQLWDTAFEEGRLAALDEFQDRFCVCMKS